MSETKNPEKNTATISSDDLLAEESVESLEHAESQRRGFGDTVRQFFRNAQRQRTAASKRDMSQDRTRPLVLLIAGIVGSVLLFLGVFSTPPARPGETQRDRGQPSLGRRDTSGTASLASVTPLLTAEVHSDELGGDRLSPADIESTSRRDAFSYEDQEGAPLNSEGLPQELPPFGGGELDVDRGIPVHRRDAATGAITYRYGTPVPYANPVQGQADRPFSGTFNYGGATSRDAATSPAAKSSIIYVRQTTSTASQSQSRVLSETIDVDTPALLPPGSRLIARLESAVTTALKTLVVAAIEYNYEKNGAIVIPAGTKAIGDLQQASSTGYVGIAFHTLQMPGGRTEKIEAMAMDLRLEPLKGNVTGLNKGRRFLTRALSGIGTMAAYVVGAGGPSLSRPITGETLLRDRLASNIASAGEQELSNLAFSQNIVVTVPAQTRLYVVFQKAAVEQSVGAPAPRAVRNAEPEIPTAQELRELMELRREINRLYQEPAIERSSIPQ